MHPSVARVLRDATAVASHQVCAAVVILLEPAGITVVGSAASLPPGLRDAVEAATRAPDERLCTCAVHGSKR